MLAKVQEIHWCFFGTMATFFYRSITSIFSRHRAFCEEEFQFLQHNFWFFIFGLRTCFRFDVSSREKRFSSRMGIEDLWHCKFDLKIFTILSLTITLSLFELERGADLGPFPTCFQKRRLKTRSY